MLVFLTNFTSCMVEPYIAVESAKYPIVEPIGPMMVLYQYLSRQLIFNGYLFSSVYTYIWQNAENTAVNKFCHYCNHP